MMNKWKIILAGLLLCATIPAWAQDKAVTYNETLAKKLGADDYGMKHYIFVILKTGSYKPKDSIERDALFRGHMQNIQKTADEGKLVIAGPFGKNTRDYRGIFILNTKSPEEANKWLQADPSISSGLFEVELTPWYGSAAISEYLPFHKEIEKKSH